MARIAIYSTRARSFSMRYRSLACIAALATIATPVVAKTYNGHIAGTVSDFKTGNGASPFTFDFTFMDPTPGATVIDDGVHNEIYGDDPANPVTQALFKINGSPVDFVPTSGVVEKTFDGMTSTFTVVVDNATGYISFNAKQDGNAFGGYKLGTPFSATDLPPLVFPDPDASAFFDSQSNIGYLRLDKIDAISVSGVPEPATWMMLITGFGIVGMAMRRRRIIAA